jgi:hypothetical protein
MPLPLQHPVSNPGEAVNPNGTLKEAHQIEWYNNPNNETPLPPQPPVLLHPLITWPSSPCPDCSINVTQFLDLEAKVDNNGDNDEDEDNNLVRFSFWFQQKFLTLVN